MRIELDGKEYTVSQETEQQMVTQLYAMVQEKYNGLGGTIRLLLKPVSRQILLEMEKKHGQGIRPPRGDDPTLHIVKLMLGILSKGMQDVESTITTARGTTEITTLTLGVRGQGEGGGQMVTDGNIGERQDNGGEDARRESGQTLSNITPLHPRYEA